MGSSTGPKIARSGLVAYYDASNEKSFRGLNTTNLMYGVFNFYSNPTNNTYFKTYYGTSWVTNAVTLNNSWNHLVIVSSGGASTIYRNGVSSYTGSIGTSTSATSLYVGGRYNSSEYSNVSIGHILVYNRALTAAEISQNFNVDRWRFGV